MNLFLEGFLLQAGLILALGAQNLFVLDCGLRKNQHVPVTLICILCDAILITIGVLGAASLIIQIPALKIIFGFLGVVFLIYYAFQKIKESFKYASNTTIIPHRVLDFKKAILLSLGFSLLNPHVYLDTIVLIGGYSSKYPLLMDRARFGLGATTFSAIWFVSLTCFAYFLSNFLKSNQARKNISLVSGVILLLLSMRLGSEVYTWIQEIY